MVGQLDEHPVPAEQVDQPAQFGSGRVRSTAHERAPHRALAAPGERQAVPTGLRGEPLQVVAGPALLRPRLAALAALALLAVLADLPAAPVVTEVARGDGPAQPPVPLRPGGQQQQVFAHRVGHTVLRAGQAEAQLGAEHRGHAQLPGRLGEPHRPVHAVVVGDGHRVQAESNSFLDQFLRMTRAVQETEVGVAVQFRVRHPPLCRTSPGPSGLPGLFGQLDLLDRPSPLDQPSLVSQPSLLGLPGLCCPPGLPYRPGRAVPLLRPVGVPSPPGAARTVPARTVTARTGAAGTGVAGTGVAGTVAAGAGATGVGTTRSAATITGPRSVTGPGHVTGLGRVTGPGSIIDPVGITGPGGGDRGPPGQHSLQVGPPLMRVVPAHPSTGASSSGRRGAGTTTCRPDHDHAAGRPVNRERGAAPCPCPGVRSCSGVRSRPGVSSCLAPGSRRRSQARSCSQPRSRPQACPCPRSDS